MNKIPKLEIEATKSVPKAPTPSAYYFSYDKNLKPRKLRNCLSECERHGWQFQGSVTDPKTLLPRLQEKTAKVLIVDSPDRLARASANATDDMIMQLLQAGICVLFLNSGLLLSPGDENNAEKRVFLLYELHRAQQESLRRARLARYAINLSDKGNKSP
jgi:hypothetical protein